MGISFPIIEIFFLILMIFPIVIVENPIGRFFRKEAQILDTNGSRVSKKWYRIIIFSVIIIFVLLISNMGISFPIMPMLLLVLIIFDIVLGVKWVVRFFRKEAKIAKTNENREFKRWYRIIISSVFIMFVSWICNMGWYRIILTWIPIPLVHTIAFLIINIKFANIASNYKFLGKYIIFSSVTYLLTYFLLPDGGDGGGMYAFFTLVRNDTILNVMTYISLICFIVSIVVLFIEYLQLKKYKSQ